MRSVFLTGPALAGASTLAQALRSRGTSTGALIELGDLRVCLQLRTAWWYDVVAPELPDPALTARAIEQRELLRSCDSIVCVVDSQLERREANLARVDAIRDWLQRLGKPLVPIVFALNKRDLDTAMTIDQMVGELRWPVCAHVPTIATRGEGIDDLVAALLRV